MHRTAVGLLLTLAVFAQSPAQNALSLNEQGNVASDAGDYLAAAAKYREAIGLWRTLGDDFKAHLAASLMNLGSVLCGAGQRVDGASAFVESLALHRVTLGMHHRRTVMTMTLLASDYLMLAELGKAEALIEEVLPIARTEFADDIQLARALEIQSGIFNRHNKVVESLASAEEALSLTNRIAGESSLEAALANATTAEALRANGQSARALPLYRKSLALYEKYLGPNHPRVASLLSQEGLIELQDGKLSTAEQSMQRAIAILRKGCGDCVAEMAVAQNNLGLLRLAQKRYREADESLTQSVELREKFSNGPSPELAATIDSLAFARKMLHRDKDAERLAKRAADMTGGFR